MNSDQQERANPRVLVAMATYRRPERLGIVVPALIEQVRLVESGRVLLVDNDPDQSARAVAATWADDLVRYVSEPTPGIAAARNRAFDESDDADLLVFIDDDEEPARGWLPALVECWQAWGCAAVAGPVRSVFESPPDAWVRGSKMFREITRVNGQQLGGAATNNLLLDLAQLRRANLRFAEPFGLSGGSDTMLTHQMVDSGLVIRWCADALVLEQVPPCRTTRSWVLRRNIRTANDWSRVAIALAGSPTARAAQRLGLTVRAGRGLLRGTVALTVGVLRRRVGTRARGECDLARAYGLFLGVCGVTRFEYGRPRTRQSRRT